MIQRTLLLRRTMLPDGGNRTIMRWQSSSSFLTEMFDLSGRSCIITGGGTGIGAALAMGLARAGASVVVTGRRQGVLDEAVEKIQTQLDKDSKDTATGSCRSTTQQQQQQRAFAYSCDITDYNQIPELIRSTEFLTGIPATILVNNAGNNVRQPAADLTSEHWQTSLDLMLTAPFVLTRAMAPSMKNQKYGRIINIASLQSFAAFADSIPYAAAKSGTLGLTRALAEAYAAPHGYDNVTCNAVAPGYVKTELTKSVFDDQEKAEKLARATILGRNSDPEDLVGAVVFLSSPAASYVTGQTLPVDGGFTALGMR